MTARRSTTPATPPCSRTCADRPGRSISRSSPSATTTRWGRTMRSRPSSHQSRSRHPRPLQHLARHRPGRRRLGPPRAGRDSDSTSHPQAGRILRRIEETRGRGSKDSRRNCAFPHLLAAPALRPLALASQSTKPASATRRPPPPAPLLKNRRNGLPKRPSTDFNRTITTGAQGGGACILRDAIGARLCPHLFASIADRAWFSTNDPPQHGGRTRSGTLAPSPGLTRLPVRSALPQRIECPDQI